MSVVMYRLDGRMLHGQIVATFHQALGLDSYVLVNDLVAKSETQKQVLKLAIPDDSQLTVLSCKDFVDYQLSGQPFPGNYTCIVFRYLEDVVECIDLGASINKLTIGGMFQRIGQVNAQNKGIALMVSDSDIKNFKILADNNVELTYQVSYYNKEIPLSEVVEY